MWGHVSWVLVLQSVQLEFGYLLGQNRCFLAFSIYCVVRNIFSCFICASDISRFVQKLLDVVCSMFLSLDGCMVE